MKEKRDRLEVEIKVRPEGRGDRLVELAQAAAPPGWRWVREPHTAIFDLYFDTQHLSLNRMGCCLRVRFDERSFRRKSRYKMIFKGRDEAPSSSQWLARREVRTDLRRHELLQFSRDRMPGLACRLAYECLDGDGHLPLAPICVISSFRRYFTMRSPDPWVADYLVLWIEHSTAMAARDIDVDLLLESGFIDGPDSFETYGFDLAEVQLMVDGVEEADSMFRDLVGALQGEFELFTTPKYDLCIEKLGLSPENVGPRSARLDTEETAAERRPMSSIPTRRSPVARRSELRS